MLDAMRLVIMRLGDALPDYEGDTLALGSAAARLEALAADLRFLVNEVKRLAAISMTEKRMVIEGVAQIERVNSAGKTTWDHDKLAHAVIAEAWARAEVNSPDDVARVLREAVAFSYWRKTYLREHGIDPDDFSETERGKPTLKITANTYRSIESQGAKK